MKPVFSRLCSTNIVGPLCNISARRYSYADTLTECSIEIYKKFRLRTSSVLLPPNQFYYWNQFQYPSFSDTSVVSLPCRISNSLNYLPKKEASSPATLQHSPSSTFLLFSNEVGGIPIPYISRCDKILWKQSRYLYIYRYYDPFLV